MLGKAFERYRREFRSENETALPRRGGAGGGVKIPHSILISTYMLGNGRDELMQDLISIITSFSARLYGQRRAKRQTEIIIKQLQGGDDDETS